VGNRVENNIQKNIVSSFADQHGLPLLGVVPFDTAVMQAGIHGGSILTIDGTSACRAIEKIRCQLTPVTMKEAINNDQKGGRS